MDTSHPYMPRQEEEEEEEGSTLTAADATGEVMRSGRGYSSGGRERGEETGSSGRGYCGGG